MQPLRRVSRWPSRRVCLHSIPCRPIDTANPSGEPRISSSAAFLRLPLPLFEETRGEREPRRETPEHDFHLGPEGKARRVADLRALVPRLGEEEAVEHSLLLPAEARRISGDRREHASVAAPQLAPPLTAGAQNAAAFVFARDGARLQDAARQP